ncbi:hypothetical protein Glove_294g16 [Diversispora epigaea]|uniref:Integrase catalytic domain-containing protein n=1 Tax=Diversispora epigaea TaxID=1348612 RepID=A0A397I709_9GLOM|nr:hypothetical protein Glove_294g16 [Diversispora epigaea]
MDKYDFSLEDILTSAVVAEAFVNLINNPDNHFSWNKMKLVMIDKGSEFKGDFEKLLKKHKIKNQKVNSKNTIGFVERSNQTLCEKLFKTQDAQELILPFPQRSRVWQINLPIVYALLNDTIT